MASTIKPLRLWGSIGPNPGKVAIILDALNIPYTLVPLPFQSVKEPEYVEFNPNGRLPTIEDPNTNIKLWESGAIIEYLVDTYDKDHKISFPKQSREDWESRQWLYYQATGQGPYFGQAVYFAALHPEKIPQAIERYIKEIDRVTRVLDKWLGEQKQQYGENGLWLVGGKKSFADLAYITWHLGTRNPYFNLAGYGLPAEDEYPNVKEWIANMVADKKVAEKLEAQQPQNQPPWEGFEKYKALF